MPIQNISNTGFFGPSMGDKNQIKQKTNTVTNAKNEKIVSIVKELTNVLEKFPHQNQAFKNSLTALESCVNKMNVENRGVEFTKKDMETLMNNIKAANRAGFDSLNKNEIESEDANLLNEVFHKTIVKITRVASEQNSNKSQISPKQKKTAPAVQKEQAPEPAKASKLAKHVGLASSEIEKPYQIVMEVKVGDTIDRLEKMNQQVNEIKNTEIKGDARLRLMFYASKVDVYFTKTKARTFEDKNSMNAQRLEDYAYLNKVLKDARNDLDGFLAKDQQ